MSQPDLQRGADRPAAPTLAARLQASGAERPRAQLGATGVVKNQEVLDARQPRADAPA